ncbi:DUF4394 domain-containing protein [Crenothrix sp.]|uniref:DUF4394 domain-containing protein n=1 Tax=Crenothrix sp. TaxID=3100433 RepID=UPI00374D3620
MKKIAKTMNIVAGISLALLTSASFAHDNDSNKGMNLKAVGLTEAGYLIHFHTASPRWAHTLGSVNGFDAADRYLIGIDFRVQNGLLYGVGNGGGVYSINTNNAKLSLVSKLSVPLDASKYFGVDFNPAANRLRVISELGQNLAHNIDDATNGAVPGVTAVNGALNYPAPAAPGTIAKGVTGAAYTNNDLAPNGASTATTLFDIDTVRDQVSLQSPPATGTLSATGKLGVDTDSAVGFDIYSKTQWGVTVDNFGFASLKVNGNYGLYSISLLTGKASRIDGFNERVVDIALPVNQH